MPPALQHLGQYLASEQQRAQDLAVPPLLTRRRVMVSSFLAIRKHIPDDVWASMEELRKKIIDGSVKVDRIEDAQKVRALMSQVDPGPAQ